MKNIGEVESYWNANPCQSALYFEGKDKMSTFLAIERERYDKFPAILRYGDFRSFEGKKVLEIGCGMGTDGIQFAKNGAIYTGVDLTEEAVTITRERFNLFGQKGEIVKINAEKLPFPDNYFDHVYSFGVIHHSPDPGQIVNEINRVLKKGGTLTVMLYNRTSFYYFIEVEIIRKLFFLFCKKRGFWNALFRIFNKGIRERFESFRKRLEEVKSSNAHPTEAEWVSMNTDGVFCPIARVYSRSEAKRLFGEFKEFRSEVWFIDKYNWFLWLAFGRLIPKRMERWLELNFGWFRMILARKY